MGFCFFCMQPFQRPGSRRKASKCKKLIKQVIYRLKFLQARKNAIIAQTRQDIAKLLQLGHFQRASIMVDQLYKDKCRAIAYEVINEICERIANNLPSITRNREMPMDVKVAVVSLSFAASRCGELPELNKLRILFRDWYGNEFEASNVNLLPTKLVNSELKRTLSVGSVSEDMKLELIKEITKDYDVRNYQIQEEGVVYLGDDVKEKAPPQSYGEYEAVIQPVNSETERKRTPFCSDIQAYQPLSRETSRKKSNKHMHLRKSTVDDIESRIRTQKSSNRGQSYNGEMKINGHVHPKLPYYEDLEVTFKHLSARDRS